ncbi:hypothetical protein NKG94_04695 [Micromonospora sp. M12]
MHTWHVWRPLLNHYLRTLAFRATTTDLDVTTSPAGASHHVKLTATATVDAVSTSTSTPRALSTSPRVTRTSGRRRCTTASPG